MGAGDELIGFPTPAEAFGVQPTPQNQQYNNYQQQQNVPPNYAQQAQQAQQQQIPLQQVKIRRKPPPSSLVINNQQQSSQPYYQQQNTLTSQKLQQQQQQQQQQPQSQQQHQQDPRYFSKTQQQQLQQRTHTPPQPAYPQSINYRSTSAVSSPPSAYGTIPGSIPFSNNGSESSGNHPGARSSSNRQASEMHLRELFDKVDRNGNGRLSELELSNALLNDDYSKFRPSTVRLILKLFDKENKNYIDFKEFCRLWNYIGYWRKVFTKFDKEGSQTISFSEYQNALEKIGYRLSTDTILFIFQKFSDGSLQLKFDMFVESLIWLLKITDSFKKYDYQGNGIAVIQFKDYVEEILSFN